jgi:putative oxidoreductase
MDRNRAIQISYFLLRVVSGWLLFQSGSMKWFGWFGGMPAGSPPFELASQMGVGAVIEVIGGLCILLGLFTQPAAFICSGMMAVAYWQFHAPNGTWPAQNGGMPAALLCFIFLYIAAEGGGPWSLDARLRQKRLAS